MQHLRPTQTGHAWKRTVYSHYRGIKASFWTENDLATKSTVPAGATNAYWTTSSMILEDVCSRFLPSMSVFDLARQPIRVVTV